MFLVFKWAAQLPSCNCYELDSADDRSLFLARYISRVRVHLRLYRLALLQMLTQPIKHRVMPERRVRRLRHPVTFVRKIDEL